MRACSVAWTLFACTLFWLARSSLSQPLLACTAVLEFQEVWLRLAPDGSVFARASYLPLMLTKMLQPPLGIDKDSKYVDRTRPVKGMTLAVLKRLEMAWLPVREGRIHFHETLFALAVTHGPCAARSPALTEARRLRSVRAVPRCYRNAPSRARLACSRGRTPNSHASCLLTVLLPCACPRTNPRIRTPCTCLAHASQRCEAGERLPDCALKDQLDREMRRKLDLRSLLALPVEWLAHEFFAAGAHPTLPARCLACLRVH